MKKIRINELARQLEIPSHEILEMLTELGVTEKKTHSSSIDDDVAEKIRRRVSGNGAAVGEPRAYEHEEPAPAETSTAVEEAPVEAPVEAEPAAADRIA